MLTPVVAFLVWFSASAGFRQFVLSLNPRVVTLVHAWRIAGFTFLVLCSAGLLPGGLILWQILGILDLVVAVTLGTTVRLIDLHAVSTAGMSVLPMSLIPTFAVPLLIVLHVICITQARRWKEGEGSFRERVPTNHFVKTHTGPASGRTLP